MHLYLPPFSLQTPQSFLLGGLASTDLCSGDGAVLAMLVANSPLSPSVAVSSCCLVVVLSGTCDSSPLIVDSIDIIGG